MSHIHCVSLYCASRINSPKVLCYFTGEDTVIRLIIEYGDGTKVVANKIKDNKFTWKNFTGHTCTADFYTTVKDDNGAYLEFWVETTLSVRNPFTKKRHALELSCGENFAPAEIKTLRGIEEKIARKWIA